ncbi:MAG: UDP-N-acetylmuramoyl-L-alanyl-D-glutamate--2,6-diaminopimelate ligase [Verrucomicrobia bacterium]|nr:UDP-N-acetylmuramoyl-L-alanyl-D-glutamate--2,6-diaminopimelate ligase [Verrucomicrobiota bacterium]
MKIKKLLRNIPVQAIKGNKDVEITGIASNSKLVAPGNLFIAKKGLTVDGARYIPDAVAAGASALLTDLYDPFFPQITQIIHPDVAAIEAAVAKEYYGHCSDRLFLVGITGTSGKTTTSYLVRHLFEKLKEPCGLIGGVEWVFGNHVFPSSITTPDVLTNYKLFYEMIASGCTACAMEVSSHALEQGRVNLVEFDVAIFNNLSHEHLDYHKTMEEYAEAKKKLFTSLKPSKDAAKKQFAKTAVVNADSPYASQMIADCAVKVLKFGIDQPCDLRASNISLSSSGMEFDVEYQQKKCRFKSALIGRFNVYNLLGAAGAGLARGFALEEIAAALSTFSKVPGRLECVPNDKGLKIFVDHAHKVDALSNVLSTLREIVKGRIIAVFGCGGNRDQGKRPMMGSIAESLSDVAIVTSDNPRNEDPEEIIRQILSGFKDSRKACVIVNREEAIQRAIQMAKPEDVILIAGKGHETNQIFSHQTIDFDDRKVAQSACS